MPQQLQDSPLPSSSPHGCPRPTMSTLTPTSRLSSAQVPACTLSGSAVAQVGRPASGGQPREAASASAEGRQSRCTVNQPRGQSKCKRPDNARPAGYAYGKTRSASGNAPARGAKAAARKRPEWNLLRWSRDVARHASQPARGVPMQPHLVRPCLRIVCPAQRTSPEERPHCND